MVICVKINYVLGDGTRQTEKNKIDSKRKYKIAVDFDGRREDGEYLDGRVVQAEDEDGKVIICFGPTK